MPGVLVDDTYADPAIASPVLPHSAPVHLSHPWHSYTPVAFTSSVNATDFYGEGFPSVQLSSPPRRPACLNLTSLSDMHAEDGSSLEASLLLQLSPASSRKWGSATASPTAVSALAALRQFLPSNFEDEGNAPQMDMYSCDDFRMYEFKVRKCMRGRSHDWTECPFVHPGEKARRRDPKRFHYSGTACAEFRRGSCKKGDCCEYAHGVFECWLHPTRYRTQPCKDGRGCQRRTCFFAHTQDQLRLVSQMSSMTALSSPTSPHLEAYMGCPSSTPFSSSPSKKASLPLCHMAMEVPPENYSSPASFSSPVPPNSPIVPINWSPRGITAYTLPAAAMPLPHPSTMHSSHARAPYAAVPDQWERLNQCPSLPMPQAQGESKSAMSLPIWKRLYTTSSTPVHRAEGLMCYLKQADLTQEETNWQVAGAGVEQPAGFLDGNLMLQPQGGHNVCELSTSSTIKKGISEEELLIERFCEDEEEGAPKLERVESGNGLRAQIFQSLLRSTSSQPTSCRTYEDANSEPLRSSSFVGF